MRSHYNAKFEKQKIGLTQYRQGGILKEYFVITADIIDSRNYDLSDIDKKISILNSKFDKDLMTYFDRSRGDEIQSIIKNAGAIPEIIRYIHTIFYPIKFRFGIGYGSVNIQKDMKSTSSWTMVGDVFYRARKAMDLVKSKKNLMIYTCFSLDNERLSETLNSYYLLLDVFYRKWTSKQCEVIMCYDKYERPGLTASELGISRQNVSKSLKTSNYLEIKHVEGQVSNLLKCFSEEYIGK